MPSLAELAGFGTSAGPVGDLSAAVDAIKRYVASRASDVANNPGMLVDELRDRIAQFTRDRSLQRGSMQSVMPEVREQAMREAVDQAQTLGALAGMTVYHGSPHKFTQFDASKIGTGEGAQAYGHGIYLAESPAVADQYASNVSSKLGPEGVPDRTSMQQQAIVNMFQNRKAAKLSDEAARDQTLQWAIKNPQIDNAVAEDLVPKLKTRTGAKYTVDLPDEWLPKMLDWDKPLSQQPEAVQQAFRSARESAGMKNEYWQPSTIVGAQHEYGKLANVVGPDQASALLQSQGIPGIRYLDGGSRGAGTGTSNFVVFPGMEKMLKILGVE